MNLYDYIQTIESARRNTISAVETEKALEKPILPPERMVELYNTFLACHKRHSTKSEDDIQTRRIFILIAFRLTSPRVLVGYKLNRGIRGRIADVIGCEPSLVSHSFKNLVFQYKRYKTFRALVDDIYADVLNEMDIARFV